MHVCANLLFHCPFFSSSLHLVRLITSQMINIIFVFPTSCPHTFLHHHHSARASLEGEKKSGPYLLSSSVTYELSPSTRLRHIKSLPFLLFTACVDCDFSSFLACSTQQQAWSGMGGQLVPLLVFAVRVLL